MHLLVSELYRSANLRSTEFCTSFYVIRCLYGLFYIALSKCSNTVCTPQTGESPSGEKEFSTEAVRSRYLAD